MIDISLQKSGGELSNAKAKTAAEAAKAAAEMILACGELYDGDRIVISGSEE